MGRDDIVRFIVRTDYVAVCRCGRGVEGGGNQVEHHGGSTYEENPCKMHDDVTHSMTLLKSSRRSLDSVDMEPDAVSCLRRR